MRTTLTLADDVLLLARRYARVEGISLGESLSRLAREGHRAMTEQAEPASSAQPPDEAAPVQKRPLEMPPPDKLLTAEEVRRLMDEMGPY